MEDEILDRDIAALDRVDQRGSAVVDDTLRAAQRALADV